MKGIISVCLLAGSALFAGQSLTSNSGKAIRDGESFFSCSIDGNAFVAADSSLTTTFTYTDKRRLQPAALFLNAATTADNNIAYIHIQPINDGAPAAPLTLHTNLYNHFHITYKAADNTCYNSTTAPGNLEITAIDTVQKVIAGKLNCVLYSSAKGGRIMVTNGRFRLKF